MSRLKKHYQEVVRKKMQERFGYGNPNQVPQLTKIVISMGIAEAAKDKNIIQYHVPELAAISGQQPLVTRARKAISNFKLREGQPIGLKVTLRGKRMYDFLDRFISLAAPRIRDFRGFPEQGDGRGNVTVGVSDQQIFLEVNLDALKRAQGMDITMVTTAESDEEGIELLRLFGFPFKNLPIEVAA